MVFLPCPVMNWKATLLLAFTLPLAEASEAVAIGLSTKRDVIEGFVTEGRSADAPVLVLIGGLEGDGPSRRIVAAEAKRYQGTPRVRRPFRLIALPLANPASSPLAFPPTGAAYKDNPESHYLWRWLGTLAPDLVVVVGQEDFGLTAALERESPAGVGPIPAKRVEVKPGVLRAVSGKIPPSGARLEIERRLARSPREVAEELAVFYGHGLDAAVYIPAFALIGRLRLGHLEEVRSIVGPYLDGTRDSLLQPTASHQSGHLIFGELAERVRDQRALQRVLAAANLGFDADGQPKDSMPFHNEMSDAVFMGCPILAKAGKLSGDSKYFDMALRHLRFIQKLCLRPDGLYRHSPLDEAAWGRGNAFPALGLALTLSDWNPNHQAFDPIRLDFQNHMAALARYQQPDGTWRQVIDVRGAYPEFSATAMIATAMLRGVRRGWLDPGSYNPRIERAWQAINRRIDSEGRLIDVCESTGKQKSLDDYLRRAAILDRDPRGGAMALLFATEMAGLE
jgi:rhamnogalacturonyl hydrolase YesR